MTAIELGSDRQNATLTPEGALTVALAQELRPQVLEVVAQGVTQVIFDLGRTEIVDSSGIGLLIATHNSLKQKGGQLRVINVSPEIANLFKAMRLDRHFAVQGR